MHRPFSDSRADATGKVLPYDEFRPFLDLGPEAPHDRSRWRDAVIRAETLLGKQVPYLSASMYRDFRVDGNRSRFEGAYFSRRRNLMDLVCAEKFEGKGRFTGLAVDTLWAILDESTWVVPAHNTPRHGVQRSLPDAFGYAPGDDIGNIDLFSASTGADLAAVYRLFADELDAVDPVIRRRLRELLEIRIFRPWRDHPEIWWMGNGNNRGLNNWTPWCVSNVLTAVLLAEEDPLRRERSVSYAMTLLDRFAATYPEDGGCDEGPGYWNEAGAALFDAAELIYDATGGAVSVFGDPLVRRMEEYVADFHIAGIEFVNFADGAHRLRLSPAMLSRMARRIGSEKLRGLARDMERVLGFGALEFSPMAHNIYRMFKDAVEPLPEPERGTRADETSPALPDSPAVAATDYPGLGVWLGRRDGWFLAAKGGTNGESHNHNDVGNVIVYRGGRPVLVDAGVGKYTSKTFGKERYTIWTMRSSYHNLPDLDGSEQLPGREFRGERVGTSDRGVVYELRDAYPAGAGIRSFRRESRFAENGIDMTDTVEWTGGNGGAGAEGGHRVLWHWLFAEKPVVDGAVLQLPEAGAAITFSLRGAAGAEVVPEIDVEPVELEPERLRGDWETDVLYRVLVRAPGAYRCSLGIRAV